MNKNRKLLILLMTSCVILIMIVFILLLGKQITQENYNKDNDGHTEVETTTEDPFLVSDSIKEELLTVNEYSRPGTPLKQVNAIVIHYVGNPGTTAEQNRNYFQNLAETHERSASSHYIVGLDGEIIQCVPLNEISYASNDRNGDTISIECCHPDKTGKFNKNTYDSAVKLTAALCDTYGLDPMKDVIRHYDVTGKLCPLYYVQNEDEWYEFKVNVSQNMND